MQAVLVALASNSQGIEARKHYETAEKIFKDLGAERELALLRSIQLP
jgi:hypothetical protein